MFFEQTLIEHTRKGYFNNQPQPHTLYEVLKANTVEA